MCLGFARPAEYIATWMVDQPNVGEESITDWFLHDLSWRLPQVGYWKFSRHAEAKEFGADWEWWIVGSTRTRVFRIQAKKLVRGADCYPSLAYANRFGLQIEKLIDAARRDAMLPFYALYVSPAPSTELLCGLSSHSKAEGVFFADAHSILTKFVAPARRKIPTEEVLRVANWMSCLGCCTGPGGVGADEFDRVEGYLRLYFGDALERTPGALRPSSQIPSYVRRLLTAHDEPPESEFEPSEAHAILVLDLRSDRG